MTAVYSLGAKVIKNPETWIANDFDGWGRGEGVGTVVLSPFALEPGVLDVVWPAGRCFEFQDQLLLFGSQSNCSSVADEDTDRIYRSFYDYVRNLLEGKEADESWDWFMCRHYQASEIEILRSDIVAVLSEKKGNLLSLEDREIIRERHGL